MSAMEFREPNEVLWRGVRPGHRGIQVAKHGAATNATVIVHTVTTGKTLYLCNYIAMVNTSVADKFIQVYVRNVADVTQYILYSIVMDVVGQLAFPGNFDPPLEIPAGYDIIVRSNDIGLNALCFIHGWEE